MRPNGSTLLVRRRKNRIPRAIFTGHTDLCISVSNVFLYYRIVLRTLGSLRHFGCANEIVCVVGIENSMVVSKIEDLALQPDCAKIWLKVRQFSRDSVLLL